MWLGCYDLALYCDDVEADPPVCPFNYKHPQHDVRVHHRTPHAEFGPNCETGGQARAQARRAGWFIGPRGGKVYCPDCARRRGLTKPWVNTS